MQNHIDLLEKYFRLEIDNKLCKTQAITFTIKKNLIVNPTKIAD